MAVCLDVGDQGVSDWHLCPVLPTILGWAQGSCVFLLNWKVWAGLTGTVSLGMAGPVMCCGSRDPVLEGI